MISFISVFLVVVIREAMICIMYEKITIIKQTKTKINKSKTHKKTNLEKVDP